jgi:hypothetical protein
MYRTKQEDALQRRLHVGLREVSALEEQGGIHGLGESVGCAIGEIQARLRIDALAVAVVGNSGGAHLDLIEWNDFDFVVFEQFPKPFHGGLAVADAQYACSLERVEC